MFIEVKARHKRFRGSFRATEAVDKRKEKRIHRLARHYLFSERVKLRKYRYVSCRFDIIGITFYRDAFGFIRVDELRHLEDAF